MAQLTINIPDAVLPRLLDGFAAANGYTGKAPDGSAESKAAFLKRKTIDWIRQSVRSSEVATATKAAATNAGNDVDNNLSLT